MMPVMIIAAIVMSFPVMWITSMGPIMISEVRTIMRTIVMPVIPFVVMAIAVVGRITVAISRTTKVKINLSMAPNRRMNTKI